MFNSFNTEEIDKLTKRVNRDILDRIANFENDSGKGEKAVYSELQKIFDIEKSSFKANLNKMKPKQKAQEKKDSTKKKFSPICTSSTLFFHELLKVLGTSEPELFHDTDNEIELAKKENQSAEVIKAIGSVETKLDALTEYFERKDDDKKRIVLENFFTRVNICKNQVENILQIDPHYSDDEEPWLSEEAISKETAVKLAIWIPLAFSTLGSPKKIKSLIQSLAYVLKDSSDDIQIVATIILCIYLYLEIIRKYCEKLSSKKIKINKISVECKSFLKLPDEYKDEDFITFRKDKLDPVFEQIEYILPNLTSWCSKENKNDVSIIKKHYSSLLLKLLYSCKNMFGYKTSEETDISSILNSILIYTQKPEMYIMSIRISNEMLKSINEIEEQLIKLLEVY